MTNIISKNHVQHVQSYQYAIFAKRIDADLRFLCNKAYKGLSSMYGDVSNFNFTANLKALYNKRYREYAICSIYYIYMYRSVYNRAHTNSNVKYQTQKEVAVSEENYLPSANTDSSDDNIAVKNILAKNHSVILALDLGSTTGWAIRDNRSIIASGSINFKTKRFDGGGMVFLRFKRWLTEMKNSVGDIDAVYFEEVRRHLGTAAAHKYGGFMAILMSFCEHHQIPYQSIPVQTIKKHITGKGNASKLEVIAAIKAKGFNPEDDNEADALALVDLVLTTNMEILL